MPAVVIETVKAAGLDVKKPFAWINANAIERRINYHIGKLHKAGKIGAAFYAHVFRHHFAVQDYKKNKDIVRVSNQGKKKLYITTGRFSHVRTNRRRRHGVRKAAI